VFTEIRGASELLEQHAVRAAGDEVGRQTGDAHVAQARKVGVYRQRVVGVIQLPFDPGETQQGACANRGGRRTGERAKRDRRGAIILGTELERLAGLEGVDRFCRCGRQ
jgi:hypothetical protein